MEYIASTFALNDYLYSTHGTEMSTKVNEIEDDNTVQFARMDQLIPGSITTAPRALAGGVGSALQGSGVLTLTYFTAEQAITVNNVYTRGGSTAATSATIVRFGLYTVAANGDLTLVASTANDTTIFNSVNQNVNKALSAGYTTVAGQRYACGWLIVTTGTMPTIISVNLSNTLGAAELGLAPRLTGQVTGQSNLPSSVATASVADSGHSVLYARLYT